MNRQYRRVVSQCEQIREQLADTERRVEQLTNTLCAVAREPAVVTVAHPCHRCERSFVLVRRDLMYCPACGHSRTV